MNIYEEALLQIIIFNEEDVIRTSMDGNDFGEDDKVWEGL